MLIRRCFALAALCGNSLVACGGAPEPASPEPAAAEPASPGASKPSSKKPARRAETPLEAEPPHRAKEPASEEEIERAKLEEAERHREASGPREREVMYRVTPEGLIVEVDGIRFKPKAEPVKKENGGYGIRVTVNAEATDDEAHVLLSPENGPLSFFVKIFDKNGAEQAHHSDQRVGDEPQFIMPGGPLTFSREWPSGSVKGPLWWGQKVRLEVGLWGLGRAQEKGRPLKKFFIVEMVGGAKAQAVLSPPEL